VEGALESAFRVAAVRCVATELEGEDARDVGRECQHLEIEHQLDVLAERIGHTDRRSRQFPEVAAAVARFDDLDAPLDLTHLFKVVREACLIGRPEGFLKARDRCEHPVENAAVLGQPFCALGLRRPDFEHAEQLVKDKTRVADHRHWPIRGGPADGVGVDAGVPVSAPAGLVYVLDAQLH